ncbi:MAG: STAS domain-containing protein [Ignavibacteria bacterium]|nr:STAS domain-containing protein [Ignavibacteria bacterium]
MENTEIQTFHIKPGIVLIKLPPKLLGGSVSTNFSDIIEQAKTSNLTHILLDLSNIEVINSLGLGMIVAGYTSLKKNNIALSLLSPTEKVQNLLKITHLDTIFKVYKSLDEFFATT